MDQLNSILAAVNHSGVSIINRFQYWIILNFFSLPKLQLVHIKK